MVTKLYTYDDVKQHNNAKSAWIVIHNIVYDVTSWLHEHPGGDYVLLQQAGKDGSDSYDTIHHSEAAKKILPQYKIGELVESERRKPGKPESTTFQEEQESFTPLRTCLLFPLSVFAIIFLCWTF